MINDGTAQQRSGDDEPRVTEEVITPKAISAKAAAQKARRERIKQEQEQKQAMIDRVTVKLLGDGTFEQRVASLDNEELRAAATYEPFTYEKRALLAQEITRRFWWYVESCSAETLTGKSYDAEAA